MILIDLSIEDMALNSMKKIIMMIIICMAYESKELRIFISITIFL